MCYQGIGVLTATRPAAGLVLTGSDEVGVLSASTLVSGVVTRKLAK